jgi:hypothetical protein
MPQQPELISPILPASPAPQPGPAVEPISGPEPTPKKIPGLEVGPEVFAAVVPVSGGDSGERRKTTVKAGKAAKAAPQRIPRWLERSELFLRVVLRMYIGVFVCCAPWIRLFWDQNPLFVQYPTLSIYAANGAVRGIISGLGLLNLWIAFHDAFKHRDG